MRIVITCLVLFASLAAYGGEKKTDPVRIPAVIDLKNASCPIGGEEVDGETSLVWGGVRVHFCCPGCDKKFKRNPGKALAKLGLEVRKDKKGKPVVDLANPRCPIMGGKTKEKVFGVHAGVRVHYCCPRCDKKVKKAPGKAFAALGYAYVPSVVDLRNKACPISGKPADGETSIDVEGFRVQACCPGCLGKVEKDPAAAFKKLGVDPAKVKAKAS